VEVGRTKSTIKGAVCFRFHITDFSSTTPANTSFAFVGLHFTADIEGKDMSQTRIDNYHTVTNSIFPISGKSLLADHDFSCIIGDINFRVGMSTADIMEALSLNDYLKIIDQDQLLQVKKSGKAFIEYEEGLISFPPTYKYLMNEETYDLSRTPAYTDRVLWHTGFPVNLLLYTAGKIVVSDHRPVLAQLVFLPTTQR